MIDPDDDGLTEDIDPALSRKIALRLSELSRSGRHEVNARYGLTCYHGDDNPRRFGLWRDDGDEQLVDWQDLGPHGIIWVIWANPDDAADMVVGLEHRDDDADPPEAWITLLRLPGQHRDERICCGTHARRVERIYMPDDTRVLLRWFPHGAEAASSAGFGLLDLDFQERLPPVALSTPKTEQSLSALVAYQHFLGRGNGAWGVFDVELRREVIPPIYQSLEWEGTHWVANRDDGGCDVLSVDGGLRHRYDYWPHRHWGREGWAAQKNRRWGKASPEAGLIGEFAYDSLDALQSAPVVFDLPPPPAAECALLPRKCFKTLCNDFARGMGCYKYEGLEAISPEDAGDGYADLSRAILPKGVSALLLTLRYSTERWLVLENAWAHLPAGSLLRLSSSIESGLDALTPCPPGGDDEAFVTCLVAMS